MVVKDWLIHLLGGFTFFEMVAKNIELDELKTLRIQERAELEKRISEANFIDPDTPEVAKEILQPLSMAPMSWSRLKRKLESEDAAKVRHEKT